jgi:hypothetical protein
MFSNPKIALAVKNPQPAKAGIKAPTSAYSVFVGHSVYSLKMRHVAKPPILVGTGVQFNVMESAPNQEGQRSGQMVRQQQRENQDPRGSQTSSASWKDSDAIKNINRLQIPTLEEVTKTGEQVKDFFIASTSLQWKRMVNYSARSGDLPKRVENSSRTLAASCKSTALKLSDYIQSSFKGDK